MSSGAHVTAIDRFVVKLIHAQRTRVVGKLATLALRLVGVHVPPQVTVGEGLRLPHSTTGLVVNHATRIGDRVTIFHNVTIGRGDIHDGSGDAHGGVVLEDDVMLCVGAVVLCSGADPLVVGRGAVVGANAVLTRSVPPGEVWAGAPARRVGQVTVAL